MAFALLAAAIVVSFTVDLGPHARQYAERAASQYIDRPIHIGSLSIHLLTGKVLLDDVRIDGVGRDARPFFTAKRIAVSLDWIPAFRRKPDIRITAVEMSDWRMLVERWNGGHNFPRIVRPNSSSGPRRVTVTLLWMRASRGEFVYQDREAPWGVVCPNLDLTIGNLPTYHGTASFTGGSVSIQHYEPMWANMKAQFVIDGSHVRLGRIDLDSDGARTLARGDVDLGHWPDMTYQVASQVNFPRMRQIFFKGERWDVSGDGAFTGTFHLSKEGPDLTGTFASDLAGVNAYRFPSLHGSLRWTRHTFDVWDAGARFYGGDARFTYSIKPLGATVRPTHRFETALQDVDLVRFTDFQALPGVRFAGTGSMQNLLEWPSGRFAEHRGEGRVWITPPAGIEPMDPAVFHERVEQPPTSLPVPLTGHVPIAGAVTYRYGPDDVTLENGRFATERTLVTFEGSTAWGDRSRLPFHVISSDWQESDQLLAGIITDVGAATRPVAFGGRGEFDGIMLGSFRSPRVEGRITGEDLRAFDTLWGRGEGRIAYENKYIDVADGRVRLNGSEIVADGRFSAGFPRDDGGEEIDARFRVVRRDVDSLRHAFGIDDYRVSGFLTGDFHLTGQYTRPVGYGALTIEEGVAYGEPFQKATSTVRFDGAGARFDNVQIVKGTGAVTGAAFVSWDGTYSFDANGVRIPVDQIKVLQFPQASLSGLAEFTAGGSGSFSTPRYDVRFRVNDLFVAEEGVGEVTGTLALRGQDLSGEINAASPRMALTGTGRIALTPRSDAELTFRFHDSSLDPYVRLFVPRLSPFTTAVATGSIRVSGPLADVSHLRAEAVVDAVDMRLLDYAVKNAAPVRLALDEQQVRIEGLELVDSNTGGRDTRLRVSGSADLRQERIALKAAGDANLAVLQGFFRDVRGTGRAELAAEINGPLNQPQFSGNATITDGRIRHFSLPNSLDAINGTLQFDSGGIRLDDVSATLGGGRVQLGGRIGFQGYVPSDLDVTARGEEMHLRYPEGIRSIVDMDLAIRGSLKTPTLGGTVTVKSAIWNRRVDAPGSIFDLATRRGSSSSIVVTPGEPPAAVPLRFDVQILVPSTLRVENNLARLVANADLNLRGTYDHPVLAGHADIERGEVTFEGRRYRVTRGSIEFTNPARIEPFFDVEAETNVRVPGQTYRVVVGFAGTTEQLRPTLSSDPPLPTSDVLALLFSDVRRTGTGSEFVAPEVRAIQNPNQTQTDILTSRATQALTSPISSEVGKVVEQTFGVDTFQLTPSLVDPYNQQTARFNPTARLTIGKRISDRVYLTFSRSLGTTINDQIVFLEYEESDRLSWILSRNEDSQTYALEFRVRHVF